jgi:hypothetical protein
LPSAWHSAKADFCRRLDFAECLHSAKAVLPSVFLCRVPLDLALGKECLYRVPDKKHPAKHFAPGKLSVSCSDHVFSLISFLFSLLAIT